MRFKDLLARGMSADFAAGRKFIGNLRGAALPLYAAALKEQNPGPLLIIVADNYGARTLRSAILALTPAAPVLIFEDRETLPYDRLSPHQDIISGRLRLLACLPGLRDGIIISPLSALMCRLPPINYIKSRSFVLNLGQKANPAELKRDLLSRGYLSVKQVLEHGEFAARGSILDIYPMGADEPYRVDFFDDEVDSIRVFDPDTQRSLRTVENISLLPAHEFPLDEDGVSVFRSNYRAAFPGANLSRHLVYQTVSRGGVPAGIEYYLPLFFPSTSSFFDYLPASCGILAAGDPEAGAGGFFREARERAGALIGSADHPPLPPETLFLTPEQLETALKGYKTIIFSPEPLDADRAGGNAPFQALPEISFSRSEKGSERRFSAFCAGFIDAGGRILITAISEGRRQTLREILPEELIARYGIRTVACVTDFILGDMPLGIATAPFDTGLVSRELGLAILTESELLGFQIIRQRQNTRKSGLSEETLIKNLSQLTEGQLVVHVDHGIGRYRGLRTLTIGGIEGEYLAIEYRNGDLLNIPITSLNRVARYSGQENPPLSQLGSDSWHRKKAQAARRVLDIAAELLDLYARREAHEGRAFMAEPKALEEFASGFGYQETPDQAQAIAATLRDLASPRPMDRLVCGDVGFGKTEVALRAAFVVASAGAQVAVLVPTTILADQHFQNFSERFAGTPINVEVISRFKSAKTQSEILGRVESGAVDIIIGTHKLLSKTVKFKDLGLIIVDEEHRFGVRQKERLKQIRASVDILTLTATPIPRTLNMALEGMRSLSIIATAPEHRLAVKTFVMERSDPAAREAITRELRRGGQIYYLHNDVATISQRAEQLRALVPEARVGIGHGQLSENELQKVMRDFYHQRFNLLVCSTIIENGLDIPTANTIIIDRADSLGLAQLHQIRGRVGRSHHQAYAYLFTPPASLMSREARMRLDALASLDDLGAGFVLATHDLEIRGAGELLGEEQSGQIEQIGFALYSDMLTAAVRALREGHEPSLGDLTASECELKVDLPCLFPETYIADISTRLSLYKRLAGCGSPEEFEDLKIELIDRFGPLPESARTLFQVSGLKKTASDLGITRILVRRDGGTLELGEHHRIDPSYLVALITRCRHGEYRISGTGSLRYAIPETPERPRLKLLEQLLTALSAHRAGSEAGAEAET